MRDNFSLIERKHIGSGQAMNRNVCGRSTTRERHDEGREVSPIGQSLESAEQGHHSGSGADAELAPIRLLRLRDVCTLTGLGKSIIYRMQSEKRFPLRVKITEHAVGWVEAEICVWIAQRMSNRNRPSMPE